MECLEDWPQAHIAALGRQELGGIYGKSRQWSDFLDIVGRARGKTRTEAHHLGNYRCAYIDA